MKTIGCSVLAKTDVATLAENGAPEKCGKDSPLGPSPEEVGEEEGRQFRIREYATFVLQWVKPELPGPCFQLVEVVEEGCLLRRILRPLLELRSD